MKLFAKITTPLTKVICFFIKLTESCTKTKQPFVRTMNLSAKNTTSFASVLRTISKIMKPLTKLMSFSTKTMQSFARITTLWPKQFYATAEVLHSQKNEVLVLKLNQDQERGYRQLLEKKVEKLEEDKVAS